MAARRPSPPIDAATSSSASRVASSQHEIAALFRQGERGTAADAAARSGDQRDLVFQSQLHPRPSWCRSVLARMNRSSIRERAAINPGFHWRSIQATVAPTSGRRDFVDDHQGKSLHCRCIRASDAARTGQDGGAASCRGGARRARRRRPHPRRRRRLFLRRRCTGSRSGVDGRVYESEAASRRLDRARRHILCGACRPCRRGNRARQMQRRADYACREAAQRGHGDRHGASAA